MAQITSDQPVRLIINADVCDARRVKEENYSMYEAILINSDLMIVNDYSKNILNRLGVSINSDNTLELADDDDYDPVIKTITGPYTISPGMSFTKHTLLTVTAPLTIEKGVGANELGNIDKITLTGPLICAQSAGGLLPTMVHTGPTILYPDDCILLDSGTRIDKYFALRAREGSRFFVRGSEGIIIEPDADVEKLAAKNISFIADRMVIHEGQVEQAAPLINEQAVIEVVPDGMAYIADDVTLDENFLRRHGGDLYIAGDLEVDQKADAAVLCSMIGRLTVKGKTKLTVKQNEYFRNLPNAVFDELEIQEEQVRHRINDLVTLHLDRQTLENYPQGVEISDVASLTIAPDIPVELIYERLRIDDVANVRCSTFQAGAVGAVSHDVANIRGVSPEEAARSENQKKAVQERGLIGGLMAGLFGTPDWGTDDEPMEDTEVPPQPQQDPGVRLINADRYIL